LRRLRFGSLVRAMAKRNVRKLVRHHRGKLGFIVSHFDGAPIHKNETSGQRKRIDCAIVYAVKFPRIFRSAGIEMRDQFFAKLRQVRVCSRQIARRQLPLRIKCSLFADLNVLLG